MQPGAESSTAALLKWDVFVTQGIPIVTKDAPRA
jgi:hypothetical protein